MLSETTLVELYDIRSSRLSLFYILDTNYYWFYVCKYFHC